MNLILSTCNYTQVRFSSFSVHLFPVLKLLVHPLHFGSIICLGVAFASATLSDSDDNEMGRPAFGGLGLGSGSTGSEDPSNTVASDFIVAGQKTPNATYSDKAEKMMVSVVIF